MAVEPITPQDSRPKFVALHHLFVQIPSVEEALQHATVYKRVNGILEDTGANPGKVPGNRLRELVERGELYAIGGQRHETYDELPEPWCASRRELLKRLRDRRTSWNHRAPETRKAVDDGN